MTGNAEHPWLMAVGLLVGVAFGITPLLLAWLWARVFSPNKPGAEKNATYECGLESRGAWIQFGASYYLYAIVFLYPSVQLRMDFRDPNAVGTFAYHHLLEHEDGGMMGLIRVVPAPAKH